MNLILFTILLVELLSVVDDTDSQACVKPALKNPGNSTPCLPTCANDKGKKQKKKCSAKTKCKCDKECGFSCIKHKKNCDPPPEVEDATFVVYRKNNVVRTRFMLYDKVVYNCQPGYIAVDTLPRLCVPDRGWTGSTICARDCGMRDLAEITLHNMTCGIPCVQNSDCAGDHTCICDGPCARTCVDPDMSCPNVTDPDNGVVEYTGEGLSRIAHYLCNDGFYVFSGSESRKCTGGGTWTGQPTVCAAVTCGDPLDTIESMGGAIVDWQPVYSYHSGDVLEFHCGGGRRLIGSRQRTCRSSGLWSGPATVCDVEDGNTQRCPHPGVPVNGRIVYSRGNFEVGSVVKFECDAGYVLFGESIQECLFFRQWSGDGAPKCKDPRYTDGAANIIAKLGQMTKNLKGKSDSRALGRFIRRDEEHGHEIFFAFDMSESMDKDSLDNSVLFAKKLVDRLSEEGTGAEKEVKYGILAFATKQKVLLDLNSDNSSPAVAKRILDKMMYNESLTYRNEIKKHIFGGTDTKAALERVDEQIAWSHADNTRKLVKRHVFILSDGKHNIGGVPGEKVREMQRMYNTAGEPDIIEFYSITTCRECKLGATRRAKEAMDELQSLTGGKPKNFIFIRNFYELNTLLDSVTDAKSDFSKCGQAGEVGSVKRQAQVVRVLGGTKASDRAWPWQALITNIDDNNDVVKTYEENVLGGGSLIDNKWVLTAAHLFDKTAAGGSVLVTLGMNERPTTNEKFDIYNTQVFLSNKIIKHPDYMSEIKTVQLRKRHTYENDIALIKLGDKRGNDNGIWFSIPGGGWVNYTDYIRPVCLPCDTSSCVRNASLSGEAALINEQLDNDEQCDIEENWMLQTGNADKSIMAVVTGFGHTKPRVINGEDNSTLARNLQEGLIKLLDHEECENWLTRGHFNERFGANEVLKVEDISERVATNMICAVSGISGNRTVDACQGDSGGPVVRRVKNPETEETCWVQIGLVSFGYGCGQKNEEHGAYPGYYTNVARFIPWIRNEMNNN